MVYRNIKTTDVSLNILVIIKAALKEYAYSSLKCVNFSNVIEEKRLVDNLLDTLYEKNALNPCDIKTKLTPDN